MSAASMRMLDAADSMRREPDPLFPVLSDWLTRVAMDATRREPFQPPDTHAAYLATGERADATRAAETYLTAIHEGATP
jgi:hypothetical protein